MQDKSKMAYAVIDSTECFSLVQDSKIVPLPSSKTEITTGKQIFSNCNF